MSRWRILPLLLMLAGAVLPVANTGAEAASTNSTLQWWGPTEIGSGHHIRVPVEVSNPHPWSMTNGLVRLEVDVSELLADAGWVTTPSGDRDLLQSFDLDLQSLRVVKMTSLQPPSPGSSNGRLLVHDPLASGLERFVVPSVVVEGSLDGVNQVPFDARSNPVVTVFFRESRTLLPEDATSYVIYLDSLTNRPDRQPLPAPAYDPLEAGQLEGSLYAPGPALTMYGHIPAASPNNNGQANPTVALLGLHDQTRVTTYTLQGGKFQPVDTRSGFPNPLNLNEDQIMTVTFDNTFHVDFRMDGTAPFMAWSAPGTFVPSYDGGFVGDEFYLVTRETGVEYNNNDVIRNNRAATQNGQDSRNRDVVYFMNAGGSDVDTRVRLTPLNAAGAPVDLNQDGNPGNDQQFFDISRGSNNLPYSTNPYGPNGQNQRPASGTATGCHAFGGGTSGPQLPRHPQWKAEVVQGGPVLLQRSTQGPLSQAPSWWGAPTGTDFFSVLLSTDTGNENILQQCNLRGGQRASWTAASQGAGIRITSPEVVGQLDPPTTNPSTVSYHDIPPLPEMRRPTNNVVLEGRPMHFGSDGADVWLYTGQFAQAGPGNVPLTWGPFLGSDGGREFQTIGETTLIAPYPNTHLVSQVQYAISGVQTLRHSLGSSGVVDIVDRPNLDRVLTTHIRSTKPVFALPTAAPSAFFGGIPAFLEGEPTGADFRGQLISLKSPSGVNPVTRSALPGEQITYPLELTNVGRELDGSAPTTTVVLSINTPDGWEAELDRPVVTLNDRQPQKVALRVTPPADAPARSLGVVSVAAVVKENGNIQSAVDTVTYIKRSFDVGLWFDRAPGAKNQEMQISAGNSSTFHLVVKNLGTVLDFVRLEAPGSRGWQTLLLDKNGAEVTEIQLAPSGSEGDTADVFLHVTPPPDVVDDMLVTPVTATSVSSEAAFSRALATTKLRAPSNIQVEVQNLTRQVLPGEEAVFPFILHNKGAGPAELILGIQDDGTPGWTPGGIFILDPVTLERVPLPQNKISLVPGDRVELFLATTAPETASAGDLRVLRLAVQESGVNEIFQTPLSAIVKPHHSLEARLSPEVVEIARTDEPVTIHLRLMNQGNLDEVLEVRLADVPASWKVDVPNLLTVPRGGTQEIEVVLTPYIHATPGDHPLLLSFRSQDGAVTEVDIPVVMRPAASLDLQEVETLLAQPGQDVEAIIPLRNNGNTPVTLHVQPGQGEGWIVSSPDEGRSVPPGVNSSLRIAWSVPASAPSGVSSHVAVLRMVPEDPGALTISQPVTSAIDVDRSNLLLQEVRTVQGPGGLLVVGSVANDGARSVAAVWIHLKQGDESLDRVLVENLAAGGASQFTLLASGHSAVAGLTVDIDPDEEVVELDEGDNGADLDGRSGERAPLAPLGLLVLAFLAPAAWRRGRP